MTFPFHWKWAYKTAKPPHFKKLSFLDVLRNTEFLKKLSLLGTFAFVSFAICDFNASIVFHFALSTRFITLSWSIFTLTDI